MDSCCSSWSEILTELNFSTISKTSSILSYSTIRIKYKIPVSICTTLGYTLLRNIFKLFALAFVDKKFLQKFSVQSWTIKFLTNNFKFRQYLEIITWISQTRALVIICVKRYFNFTHISNTMQISHVSVVEIELNFEKGKQTIRRIKPGYD